MAKKSAKSVTNVYEIRMRNWLYNAGIIGFLRTLSYDYDNDNIRSFNQLQTITNTYKDNFVIYPDKIVFNSSVLDNFYDKYEKLIFCEYFNVKLLKKEIDNLLSQKTISYKDFFKKNNKNLKEKGIYIFIRDYDDIEFPNKFELSDPIPDSTRTKIQELSNKLISKINSETQNDDSEIQNDSSKAKNNNQNIYDTLKQKNSKYFISFYDKQLRDLICAPIKMAECIESLKKGLEIADLNVSNQTSDHCIICQKYKHKHEFENIISKFEGLNFYNFNWAWNYETKNLKICDLCAVIFFCSPLGLLHKSLNSENSFFAINNTTSIEDLYNSFSTFYMSKKNDEKEYSPFQSLIKIIKNPKYTDSESLNFIEISENSFKSRGVKRYNINNFYISKKIANFLINELKVAKTSGELNFGTFSSKSGNKAEYQNITDDIIRKTLDFSLDYSYLPPIIAKYLEQIDDKDKSNINISSIIQYIVKFVLNIKKEQDMENINFLISRAYDNGKKVRKKISQENENKVRTLAYQLLNDLKICDVNAFMDKYLRTIMAYNCESISFTRYLSDNDVFLAVGYSFVNGLLSPDKRDTINDDNTDENDSN